MPLAAGIGVTVSPGIPPGIRNAVSPNEPLSGNCLVIRRKTSATSAFEISVFSPLSRKPSAVSVAVVVIRSNEEPQAASVTASAPTMAPVRRPSLYAFAW